MTAESSLSEQEIDSLRARLREIRGILERAEDDRAASRQLQLEQIAVALQHGAGVSQMARDSGLSRAWLSQAIPRLPQHAGEQKDPQLRDGAIDRVRELAAALSIGGVTLNEARAERDGIIRSLAPAMGRSRLQQQDVAEDAGITSEWIRRLLLVHRNA